MSFKIGIVGLPNVGKSTIFKAITKKQVDSKNYPFCTIEPNIGTVRVPDKRVEEIGKISKSNKNIYTTIEFVDIAGLVRGAHKGRGLGNKFLSHIREVDAIVQVIREFDNKDIVHVEGNLDPKRDRDIIDFELMIADVEMINKVILKVEKEARSQEKESVLKLKTLQKIKENLEKEIMIRDIFLEKEEKNSVKELNFLTSKPIIYLKNVDSLRGEDSDKSENFIEINAKIEEEVAGFPEEEARKYLNAYNLHETGLNKLIKESYCQLNLISFFTSGEKETKAWTVEKDSTAPVAAGKIHSDFEKYFIRAEVLSYSEFIDYNGWVGAREKGKIKDKGKDYVVSDGDIIFFKVGQK